MTVDEAAIVAHRSDPSAHETPQSVGTSREPDSEESEEIPEHTARSEDSDDNECRICKESGGEMISPCGCQGSLAQVHAHCLQEWLLKREQNVSQTELMTCEICQQPYRIDIQREMNMDCETLCSRTSWSFYFEFGTVLLCLTSLLYIFIISRTRKGDDKIPWDIREPTFCVIVGIGVGVTIFSLVTLRKMFRQWRVAVSRPTLVNEFSSAGLVLSSFDLDDLTKAVIPRVNELLYDTLAYVVKTDSAAEHFLLGTDSVSDRDGRRALLDLIKGCVPPGVCQTLQEEHSQLRYPARVDPRWLLAKELRLVRDNRSEDWTPTESTRKYKLHERLDPEFYAAVRVRYPMPADLRPVPLSTLTNLVTHIFVAWEQQQAELGVAAGPGVAGAAYSGVDGRVLEVLGLLTSRLEKIEAAIKFQKAGGAAALPRNRRGKGLDGFRAGSSPTPPVGFDRENRRALPLCHRCGREGEGKKYHGYKECPYHGGKNAAETAAYSMPADAQGADEDMRTLALCQIFQVAADDGSDAFAAAVAEYGAPAVLAGGESDGIDVSAYGFAVTDSSSGVLSELEALTGQVRAMEERVGVHLSQVSLVEGEGVIEHRGPADAPSANAVASGVPRQVVPPVGGASAGGALATGGYMAHVMQPTEEFPGGVEMLPVRHYTPPMTLGLYGGGGSGIDLAVPPHRAGDGNIADIFTRPLPPQAVFYNNPSHYGLELHSDTDSGYGSAMGEVD
ncbi:hypothetical protein CYMTET_56902 [Cymbomonas tetramitiformis]|uniref:RING-CH-type domain-containing protein n=1 Tax=Cymbomonas tetramitiformis TaxID=36881 RepID=A0AAE0ELD4_9CHLO|nr:hypothetical protein CYMTET_56902 [Cymbomonas tetramitiformis]